ncbi:hypothetical protein EDB89DRAFT_1901869 [Lactarius sanguifluus]|nr:hypothetical protein EDB89DRAFT_1901869 [Lactarius sanguifluus]
MAPATAPARQPARSYTGIHRREAREGHSAEEPVAGLRESGPDWSPGINCRTVASLRENRVMTREVKIALSDSSPWGLKGREGEGEPEGVPNPETAPFYRAALAQPDEDVQMLASSPVSVNPPGLPTPSINSGSKAASSSPLPVPVVSGSTPMATPSSPPAAPSPPPEPKGKGKSVSTAQAAPSPCKGASTATENDGFIQVSRPKASFSVITTKAVQQQQTVKVAAKLATTAQGRSTTGKTLPSASPKARNVTKVVVSRNSGFPDPAKEAIHRATPAGIIAQGVRTAIERGTPNPIRILNAQWAKNVDKTGNFIYTIVGNIPMECILQFGKFLLQPFPGGNLIPADGWCWAQLRDVLVFDEEGVFRDGDDLENELRRNPAFETAQIVTQPHWAGDINSTTTATSTVVFAYIDSSKTITQRAIKEGISMFSFSTKFIFCGDTPRPKQCGRCFEMGHATNTPECRWNGKNRCVRCGGNHHHEDHDMACTANTHKSADRCDCKFKCLVCGKIGHNARSRNCKMRGDFPPPRAIPKIRDEGKELAKPPPKSILKRPTELPSVSPPSLPAARVDDEEPSLFDPETIVEEMERIGSVRPHTDKAKEGEMSTERAATRLRPASPSEVQGPLAPAIPTTRGDTKVARIGTAARSLEINLELVRSTSPSSEGVMRPKTALEKVKEDFPPLPHHAIPGNSEERLQLAQIEDRMHQIMTEAARGVAMVRVKGEWYDCPSLELNYNFRKLRDHEAWSPPRQRRPNELAGQVRV